VRNFAGPKRELFARKTRQAPESSAGPALVVRAAPARPANEACEIVNSLAPQAKVAPLATHEGEP
jgi:hypothetical protein